MKLTKTILLAIALISMVYANGMILLSASLFTVIRTLSRWIRRPRKSRIECWNM